MSLYLLLVCLHNESPIYTIVKCYFCDSHCTMGVWLCITYKSWGHGGAVVTDSPPTSEVKPQTFRGKLVVAYRWSAVYSIQP